MASGNYEHEQDYQKKIDRFAVKPHVRLSLCLSSVFLGLLLMVFIPFVCCFFLLQEIELFSGRICSARFD